MSCVCKTRVLSLSLACDSVSNRTERERHARAEDGLRAHTRSASREGLGGAAHDAEGFSLRSKRAVSQQDGPRPLIRAGSSGAGLANLRGVLISTSELHFSQPYLAMMSGLRVAQSAR